jgi:hypothetical protein
MASSLTTTTMPCPPLDDGGGLLAVSDLAVAVHLPAVCAATPPEDGHPHIPSAKARIAAA